MTGNRRGDVHIPGFSDTGLRFRLFQGISGCRRLRFRSERGRIMADTHVLVLNASYEPLQRVSMRHAIKMLVREVAVIEEEAGGSFGPFPVPKVLRLVRYVVTRWMHRRSSCAPSPRSRPATRCAPTAVAAPRPSTTSCLAAAAARSPGTTPSRRACGATTARPTAPLPRPAWRCSSPGRAAVRRRRLTLAPELAHGHAGGGRPVLARAAHSEVSIAAGALLTDERVEAHGLVDVVERVEVGALVVADLLLHLGRLFSTTSATSS